MKRIRLMAMALLLLTCLLASCGTGDVPSGGTGGAGGTFPSGGGGTFPSGGGLFKNHEWKDPAIAMFGDSVVTWKASGEADGYEIYLDGALAATVFDEYFVLSLPDSDSHTAKVVKVVGKDRYHSDEFTVQNKQRTTRTISSVSALGAEVVNGAISFGGLMETAVVLDLRNETASSASLPAPLTVNAMLKSLTIIGRSDFELSSFKLLINERTEPLIIEFYDLNARTSSSLMVSYAGSSSFSCDMLMHGTCSFVNTFTGASGTRGSDASGFASAGNGTSGGNGGDLFSLPTLRLFCETTPAFTTGNGGSGGGGGTGQGLAHGGFGGSGGRGGCVFRSGQVTCFNASFSELSGKFGLGGRGGPGGTGFSGPRSDGSAGSDGRLSYNAEVRYLSRTDGVIHTSGGTDSLKGDFNLTCKNGYLIWNEQAAVSRYEILFRGNVYDTTTLNAYVLPDHMWAEAQEITVRAVLASGEVKTSKPCQAIDCLTSSNVVPSGKTIILTGTTGATSIVLDATKIPKSAAIIVMPDVDHLILLGEEDGITSVFATITAENRYSNLTVTLDNVALCANESENAITVNGGRSVSAATDPMLIIHANGSAIAGGNGKQGTDGQDSDGFSFGGDGGDGSPGGAGILAPLVVFTGDDLYVSGGYGGDGGNGGDSEMNEGGDGGNGGTGGCAVKASVIYVMLDDRSATLTLARAPGGSAGRAGVGFFGDASSSLTSAVDGKAGSPGTALSGTQKTYNGLLVLE